MTKIKLTKYTHACITLEAEGKKLVIDPGNFSETDKALANADAILLTHEHPDHIDPEVLKNNKLPIYGPESIEGVDALKPSDKTEILGFNIEVFGGQHALIHPKIPVIRNNAYLINDYIYVPGDSFTVPPAKIKHLFVPMHAPWSKASEVIDFAIAVKPEFAYNIHDSLLTDAGLGFTRTHLEYQTKDFGITYKHLMPGETAEL
ncbi:MAG: MBL fold metallo-hydrolase [Micrococcaceae bacterium]